MNRAYSRGIMGLLVVSLFCYGSMTLTVLFIIISAFLESQNDVRVCEGKVGWTG